MEVCALAAAGYTWEVGVVVARQAAGRNGRCASFRGFLAIIINHVS